jgi:hypothetical protein
MAKSTGVLGDGAKPTISFLTFNAVSFQTVFLSPIDLDFDNAVLVDAV